VVHPRTPGQQHPTAPSRHADRTQNNSKIPAITARRPENVGGGY